MLNVAHVKEIVLLINQGWRPYNEQPNKSVYESLGCTRYIKSRPAWFVKGDKFLCISCPNKCSLSRPSGFPLPLPIHYPSEKCQYTITPKEMVKRKSLLNVFEVAYCLNISTRKVYSLIDNAKLLATKEKPHCCSVSVHQTRLLFYKVCRLKLLQPHVRAKWPVKDSVHPAGLSPSA